MSTRTLEMLQTNASSITMNYKKVFDLGNMVGQDFINEISAASLDSIPGGTNSVTYSPPLDKKQKVEKM